MITNKDMYRNPPAPVGYVCTNPPDIVIRKVYNEEEDLIFHKFVVDSGILDEPDCSIYDHFVINSDSEDDDLIEIPFEKVPVEHEVIGISDDEEPAVEAKGEVLDTDKAEVISENLASCSSVVPKEKEKISVKTEKAESCIKPKNLDDGKQSSHKKEKSSQKKETSHNIDNESTSLKKEKKKKHTLKGNITTYDSESRSVSSRKERTKLIDYPDSSDSDSNNKKTDSGKQDNYKKESKSKKKREYDSNSSSLKLKAKIKHDYEKDEDRISKHSPSYSKNYDYDEYYDSEEDSKPNIKQEAQNIYGVYHCEVCKLTLNSHSTYQSHMTGKRHKKALNAQNVAQAVAKSFVSTNVASKCPKPPPRFIRIELNEPARIQDVLDKQLKSPCPGLHHVFEIHGVVEITYYCSLCDAPCNFNSIVPHLQGFKHQLNCLKHYNPSMYERVNYKSKYLIDELVRKELTAIVKEKGRKALRVFRDIPESENVNVKSENASRSENVPQPDYDQPSTSRQGLGQTASDIYSSYSTPDPSKSGFYCKLCDSHSNSENMWRNHIAGKRHLANMKKAPGSAPSKSKYIPAPPGTRPKLDSILSDIHEPIVGLHQIREIHKPDIDCVTFTCYLCSACISEFEIIDHILSRKHREKYLEKISFEEYFTLRNCHISQSSLESIIEEMCASVEYNEGRGRPEVVYAKNAIIPHRM